ncbi:AAA family ATPase [Pseudoduganella sp. LjRoot289]|uniref:ExeA family protein n=1 Tax=Pseudoduganella sp. LjRoot289 TaxID=3342314 RepID=UPI003ED05350
MIRSPFDAAPDAAFYYEDAARRELLGALQYALKHGDGIIKVTGDPGSGKSMLCAVLEARYAQQQALHPAPPATQVLRLALPTLDPRQAMHAIARQLGLAPDGMGSDEVLRMLDSHLNALRKEGKQGVLLVEEAQTLPLETLEELRLLTNLDVGPQKLLPMVLLGGPELNTMLRQARLRQLRERITLSFVLPPLPLDLAPELLDFRLRAAGHEGMSLIQLEAARLIARTAGGDLRRLLALADNALASAVAVGAETVSVLHVKAAIKGGSVKAGVPAAPQAEAIESAAGAPTAAAQTDTPAVALTGTPTAATHADTPAGTLTGAPTPAAQTDTPAGMLTFAPMEAAAQAGAPQQAQALAQPLVEPLVQTLSQTPAPRPAPAQPSMPVPTSMPAPAQAPVQSFVQTQAPEPETMPLQAPVPASPSPEFQPLATLSVLPSQDSEPEPVSRSESEPDLDSNWEPEPYIQHAPPLQHATPAPPRAASRRTVWAGCAALAAAGIGGSVYLLQPPSAAVHATSGRVVPVAAIAQAKPAVRVPEPAVRGPEPAPAPAPAGASLPAPQLAAKATAPSAPAPALQPSPANPEAPAAKAPAAAAAKPVQSPVTASSAALKAAQVRGLTLDVPAEIVPAAKPQRLPGLLKQSLAASKTWLADEPADNYCVQIENMPASESERADKFLADTRAAIGLSEVHSYPMLIKGEPRIAIVYGSFASARKALEVQAAYEERLGFRPKIRTIKGIRTASAEAEKKIALK